MQWTSAGGLKPKRDTTTGRPQNVKLPEAGYCHFHTAVGYENPYLSTSRVWRRSRETSRYCSNNGWQGGMITGSVPRQRPSQETEKWWRQVASSLLQVYPQESPPVSPLTSQGRKFLQTNKMKTWICSFTYKWGNLVHLLGVRENFFPDRKKNNFFSSPSANQWLYLHERSPLWISLSLSGRS